MYSIRTRLAVVAFVGAVAACFLTPLSAAEKTVPDALNFKMKSIDGKTVDLAKYQGKVVMIVNVASKCGYTKQYEQLEAIHEKYAKDGLVILGFPANEFGKQEPGSDADIAEFCTSKYGVKFDMFSKVVVKGKGQCDLYKLLTDNDKKPIAWNFEKFLVSREGKVVNRYKSAVKPDSKEMIAAIEKELATK